MMTVFSKWLRTVSEAILNRWWYAHPAMILVVQAAPEACLRTLADAARPSTERLHLRNLFTGGRRYWLYPQQNGFQMHITSKTPWQRRRRSSIAAVTFGKFSEAGAGITRIQVRTRMTLFYLLDIVVLPLWMGLLLAFGPMSRPLAAAAAAALLVLSWLWHRYNAVLQAVEMIYFIQVALDDLTPAEIPALSPQNTIYTEFGSQWQKFYQRHKDEQQ